MAIKRLLTGLAVLLILSPALAQKQPAGPNVSASAAQSANSWQRYENLVYQYRFSLPEDFIHAGDALRRDILAGNPFGERLHDTQIWRTADGSLTFEFQLKQKSYASLEEEIAKLPQSLELLRPQLEAEGYTNLRFVQEGAIIHHAPAGDMLENAMYYDSQPASGPAVTTLSIYYDFYQGNNEYIFLLYGPGLQYDQAKAMLDRIVDSAVIAPITLILPNQPRR